MKKDFFDDVLDLDDDGKVDTLELAEAATNLETLFGDNDETSALAELIMLKLQDSISSVLLEEDGSVSLIFDGEDVENIEDDYDEDYDSEGDYEDEDFEEGEDDWDDVSEDEDYNSDDSWDDDIDEDGDYDEEDY